MSELSKRLWSKRLWVGGARAITGVAIIAAAVVVALALGSGILPVAGVERGVISVPVDTSRSAQNMVVCPGAFAELGADPTQPTKAVPSGEGVVQFAGNTLESVPLAREIEGGSAPFAISGVAGEPLAAVELQNVATPTLQGLVATTCVEPVHEQWLVGGTTELGANTTLVLSNPFSVPATVVVNVFDDKGQLDEQKIAGVVVPAKSQRIVSINGYAPATKSLAVRVTSTGAAVSASLAVGHTVDIRSYAVDTVSRQLAASQTLIFAGVKSATAHDHGPTGELGETDDFPVVVRLLAPASPRGTAEIVALMADGSRQKLGNAELEGQKVFDFVVEHWPEGALGVEVNSSVAVVGGVFASGDAPPEHDYAWFAPAPLLPEDTAVAVAVVTGGELVVVNPSTAAAEIELTGVAAGTAVVGNEPPSSAPGQTASETPTPTDGPASSTPAAPATPATPVAPAGPPTIIKVPAGGAIVVPASALPNGAVTLKSATRVAAGVSVIAGAKIAGYPVLPGAQAAAQLIVYTR